MALATAVQGGLRPSQALLWLRDDGSAENLTGATLTGKLSNRDTQQTRPIAGSLTVLDGPAGSFLWSYAAADVAEAGEFDVQFDAAFAQGPSPARSFITRWTVAKALS